jgi:hypothetical protein
MYKYTSELRADELGISVMDFLFHVPFFCTAAAVMTEILRFVSNFWVSWGQKADIISPVPILPKSTRCKQAIFNKGSLFYSHCALYRKFLKFDCSAADRRKKKNHFGIAKNGRRANVAWN